MVSLAGHRIGDEQNLLWVELPLQRLHFVHESVVDMQTSGGVYNEHVASVIHSFAAGFFG